jgi:hypothetical protein
VLAQNNADLKKCFYYCFQSEPFISLVANRRSRCRMVVRPRSQYPAGKGKCSPKTTSTSQPPRSISFLLSQEPVISLVADRWYRWRMVFAAVDSTIEPALVGCETMLLAKVCVCVCACVCVCVCVCRANPNPLRLVPWQARRHVHPRRQQYRRSHAARLLHGQKRALPARCLARCLPLRSRVPLLLRLRPAPL